MLKRNMDEIKKIKIRLTGSLKKSGLTQVQICEAVGVNSVNTLRNWLDPNHSYLPKTLEIIKLSQILDVSIEYLLTGKEDNNRVLELELKSALKEIDYQKEIIDLLKKELRGDNLGVGIKKL